MSPETIGASLEIGQRRVGAGHPLFVIAEIGLNHGGSPDRALALVDAAAAAGASAVKLQTLFASELVAAACPAPAHVQSDSLRDFFSTFELDEAAHRAIAQRAHRHGLAFLATPFSLRAVALLERVGVDAYKIASGDLTWDGLIERAAATGRPLVISTGMAALAEASHALGVARRGGAAQVALLHCVSAYPVPRGSENLRAIRTLASTLEVPVGLSDHGEDTFAVPMAVALGASIYERHLVLAHDDGSIDGAVSSTREELARTIQDAARAAAALGSGEKICLPAEAVERDREPPRAVRGAGAAGRPYPDRRGHRGAASGVRRSGRTAAGARRTPAAAGGPGGARVPGRRLRRPPRRTGGGVTSLNVLVTAGSRRVALVNGFRSALGQTGRRPRHRHRREPAVPGRALRRPRVSRPAVVRAGLHRRDSAHRQTRTRPARGPHDRR